MGKDLKGKQLPVGISQRSDGYYTARYKGKTKYARTLTDAKRAYRELVDLMDSGKADYSHSGKIKLDDYFAELLEAKEKRGEIKSSTKISYRSTYQLHISPVFGMRPIGSIKRAEVRRFRDSLIGELSNQRINHLMVVLSMIFRHAIEDDIIDVSPVSIRALPTDSTAGETIHRALTQAETDAFFSTAADSWYLELFELAIKTGMRMGELLALQWVDIDRKQELIHVRHTITRNEKEWNALGTPKTKQSVRDVPITPAIADTLNRQRRKTEQFGLAIDGRVFKSPYGHSVYHLTVHRELEKIIKKARLKRFASHAFRDTFATRAIESGMNPKTLQALLGHASISMTMDIYAHSMPETRRKELEKMG